MEGCFVNIKILRSAKNDLQESYHFYELQQEGIGAYFLEALSADIESLKLYAGIHPVFFGRYHRLLSKRFPFVLSCLKQQVPFSSYSTLFEGITGPLSYGNTYYIGVTC